MQYKVIAEYIWVGIVRFREKSIKFGMMIENIPVLHKPRGTTMGLHFYGEIQDGRHVSTNCQPRQFP